MRPMEMPVWIAFAGLVLVIALATDHIVDAGQPPSAPTADIVYRPPPVGRPGGRVGGSTRSGSRPLEQDPVALDVLVPEGHIGLTGQEQPSLYWYLSKSTTHPIEVTIIDDRAVQPLLETRVGTPIQPGVHRVRLADYGVRLSTGVVYRWSVALVVDPDDRAKDILASGPIERIVLPEALRAKLAGAGAAQAPQLYAAAGIWYDALTALSDLLDAAPYDPALRRQRASLLQQVGLPEIAAHDLRHSRGD